MTSDGHEVNTGCCAVEVDGVAFFIFQNLKFRANYRGVVESQITFPKTKTIGTAD